MSKNRLLGLMIALGLTPLALLFVSSVAVYAQKQQAYRQDVDDLLTIAAALGYTPDYYIRSYRAFGGNTPDLLRVVYHTDQLWEQFADQVQALSFNQQRYSQSINSDFLEMDVNHQLTGGAVTLNDHYLDEDFVFLNLHAPVVSRWYLRDAQNRDIEIYYAQTPSPTDAWKRNGEIIPGNLVLISLDRETDLFTQVLPYPDLEELIKKSTTP